MRTIAAMMMVAGVGLATPSLNRRAHAASCVGDCNADGEVTVDEVLTMVNIALGTLPASSCTAGDASGDGAITIDEILAAVNNALGTCSEPPTPTVTIEASPTFTPTNSPTATPTPSSVATATDTPTATAEPTLTPLLPQVVIGNASGAPGTSVDVPISLSTRGLHLIIVAPLEFRVDADILSLESCTSALAGKPAVADMLEGGRVRLVLAGDLSLIADGLIVTCRLHIASTAATGSTPLSFQTAELADSDFHDIAATGLDGSVTVTP